MRRMNEYGAYFFLGSCTLISSGRFFLIFRSRIFFLHHLIFWPLPSFTVHSEWMCGARLSIFLLSLSLYFSTTTMSAFSQLWSLRPLFFLFCVDRFANRTFFFPHAYGLISFSFDFLRFRCLFFFMVRFFSSCVFVLGFGFPFDDASNSLGLVGVWWCRALCDDHGCTGVLRDPMKQMKSCKKENAFPSDLRLLGQRYPAPLPPHSVPTSSPAVNGDFFFVTHVRPVVFNKQSC